MDIERIVHLRKRLLEISTQLNTILVKDQAELAISDQLQLLDILQRLRIMADDVHGDSIKKNWVERRLQNWIEMIDYVCQGNFEVDVLLQLHLSIWENISFFKKYIELKQLPDKEFQSLIQEMVENNVSPTYIRELEAERYL